jgi:hypothetical protein
MTATANAQPPVAKPQPPPPVAGVPQAQQPVAAKPATPTQPAQVAPTQQPAAQAQAQAKVQPPADATTDAGPTEAQLGVRLYPGARYLGSYDAGRGQRYYLFGALQPFAEMVTFYKSELKAKGEQVFDSPLTHMFDIGKFKEETMAFPPSVTIKDYTFGGSPGYANPKPGTSPAAFPTVIQIVPAQALGAPTK